MSFAPFVLAALLLLAGHLRDVRADKRYDALLATLTSEHAAWERERQEILTRIQAPHLVPVALPRGGEPAPEPPEEDEWDLVGTIATGADL